MKKRLKIALFLSSIAVALYGCGDSSASEEQESGNSEEIITVGATGQSYPNSYRDGDELVGYDVEVLEEIADRLDYEIDWTLASFDGLMGQLATDQLDTISNAFEVTEERRETYDFTVPYTYTSTAIATSSESSFESLEDLAGETVGGVAGSNKITDLERYIEETGIDIDIRQYDTREGPQNDAENGRIAGYVQGEAILQAAINRAGLDLKIIPDTLSETEISFPFSRTERGEQLLEEFNVVLEELREDGTLAELSVKYFGEDNSVSE